MIKEYPDLKPFSRSIRNEVNSRFSPAPFTLNTFVTTCLFPEYVQNIIQNDMLKVPKNAIGGKFTILDCRQNSFAIYYTPL